MNDNIKTNNIQITTIVTMFAMQQSEDPPSWLQDFCIQQIQIVIFKLYQILHLFSYLQICMEGVLEDFFSNNNLNT